MVVRSKLRQNGRAEANLACRLSNESNGGDAGILELLDVADVDAVLLQFVDGVEPHQVDTIVIHLHVLFFMAFLCVVGTHPVASGQLRSKECAASVRTSSSQIDLPFCQQEGRERGFTANGSRLCEEGSLCEKGVWGKAWPNTSEFCSSSHAQSENQKNRLAPKVAHCHKPYSTPHPRELVRVPASTRSTGPQPYTCEVNMKRAHPKSSCSPLNATAATGGATLVTCTSAAGTCRASAPPKAPSSRSERAHPTRKPLARKSVALAFHSGASGDSPQVSHLASIVSSYTAYTDELVTLEATARHEYVCDRGAVIMLLILLRSLQKARATAEYLDTKLAQSRDTLQASSAATSAAEESARQALSHLANLFKLLWAY